MSDEGGDRIVQRIAPRKLRRAGESPDEPVVDEETEISTGSIRRAASTKRINLHPDDIANKSGHYIFSFGYPGSGKTTFQWFLMRYLMDDGDFVTKPDVPKTSGGTDWEGRRILNEWKTQWIEGRFPDSTLSTEGDIREISLEVRPLRGEKTPCRFSFLEISGELLRMVMPKANSAPRLTDTIHAYLSNEKLKFVTVLMLHPDEERNDQLFSSFMTYLDREYPGIKNRMSLAVIVSKPQESLRKLREFGDSEGRTDYHELDASALNAYFDRFCGESYQIFRTWPEPKRTLLSSLYIGRVDTISGEAMLRDPDFENISGIFAWIYNQFTGKSLGPTFFQRLFGRLSGWE